jgi:hypothetical protein
VVGIEGPETEGTVVYAATRRADALASQAVYLTNIRTLFDQYFTNG